MTLACTSRFRRQARKGTPSGSLPKVGLLRFQKKAVHNLKQAAEQIKTTKFVPVPVTIVPPQLLDQEKAFADAGGVEPLIAKAAEVRDHAAEFVNNAVEAFARKAAASTKPLFWVEMASGKTKKAPKEGWEPVTPESMGGAPGTDFFKADRALDLIEHGCMAEAAKKHPGKWLRIVRTPDSSADPANRRAFTVWAPDAPERREI